MMWGFPISQERPKNLLSDCGDSTGATPNNEARVPRNKETNMGPNSNSTGGVRWLSLTRVILAGLFGCLVMCAQSGNAQVDRGSIAGTVADTTGGTLRDAKVTILNVGTGQETQMSTDDQGNYIARSLIGGVYSVK